MNNFLPPEVKQIITHQKTRSYILDSIRDQILPRGCELPSFRSFANECAYLALACKIFERNGVEAEAIFVPKNLSLDTWRKLFTKKLSDSSNIKDIHATEAMAVDREGLLEGFSWGVAIVSSGEVPVFNGWETAKILRQQKEHPLLKELRDEYLGDEKFPERIVNGLSPSLETYLAFQLNRAITNGELVDQAKDQRTIGRATLLAENLVGTNVKEEVEVRSLCAGSDAIYPPHRIWLGSKSLHSLTQEIGFRPTITAKKLKSKHPA